MKAKRVWFDAEYIYVETVEKIIGKMPLKWFPRLKNATNEARAQFELWDDNTWLHWEGLGEDLSVEGFFNYTGRHLQA